MYRANTHFQSPATAMTLQSLPNEVHRLIAQHLAIADQRRVGLLVPVYMTLAAEDWALLPLLRIRQLALRLNDQSWEDYERGDAGRVVRKETQGCKVQLFRVRS